jgi:hypothetical protein
MEPTLQTSFIPKQAVPVSRPQSTPSSGGNTGGMGLITLLSFIILFLSIVAAGGTFAYKSYLQSKLYGPCEQTGQFQPNGSLGLTETTDFKCGLYFSLKEWNRRLQDDRLVKMQRLDNKMKLATGILDSHMSLVPLFDFLSSNTLKTVRYTKISTSNGDVILEGTASGYEDIAVQSNILNSMPEVSGALFSNLSLDQKNNVTFQLKFSVDPSRLKYVPVPVRTQEVPTTTNQI